MSVFRYNSAGQTLWSQTVDQGRTRYAYSIDGKLRYVQNAKQALTNSFSYTNYDRVGRPIETGAFTGSAFDPWAAGTDLNANFILLGTYDRTFTAYDEPASDSPKDQTFTIGKVSKTWNSESTTWFSYNAEGELTWEATTINGLSNKPKYTDYTYDLIGNVTKVEYQKNAHEVDKFTHFYTYDFEGNLTTVQTEDAFGNKKTQAHYTYYQDGSVKEYEIAEGLQNLQYRYTIQSR